MVLIIQDYLNQIAIAGLPKVSSGKFTFKVLASCDGSIDQSIDFLGTACDRVLLGEIEHSCTDKTKLHSDVGTHIYELYEGQNKIFTSNLIVYKNKS